MTFHSGIPPPPSINLKTSPLHPAPQESELSPVQGLSQSSSGATSDAGGSVEEQKHSAQDKSGLTCLKNASAGEKNFDSSRFPFWTWK